MVAQIEDEAVAMAVDLLRVTLNKVRLCRGDTLRTAYLCVQHQYSYVDE